MGGRSKGFINLFWELAGSNEEKRSYAIEKLHSTLKQLQIEDAEQLHSDVKYSMERLVTGLASGRDSVRLGFSTALTIILRHISSTVFSPNDLIELMNEKLKIAGRTKNEDKDIMLGRVFCLLSLIESKKLFDFQNNEESVTKTFKELFKLSRKKSYLSSICFHGVGQIIQHVSAPVFKCDIWVMVAPFFIGGWNDCSPELFQLLVVCCLHQSEICNKEFLKSYKWISQKAKKPELITQHNFKHLARIIAETTSCHPVVSILTHNILSTIAKSGKKKLGTFWSEYLSPALLNSSPERKYLAFKLAVFSLSLADSDQIPSIFSSDLLVNLHHALLNKSNPLNLFCKNDLPRDISKMLSQPEISPEIQYALLFELFSSRGGIHLDSLSHTGIINSVVSNLKHPALMKYIKWLKKLFLNGTFGNMGIKEMDLIMARKWSSSQLSYLVKMSSLPRNEKWVTEITKFLFFHSYFKVTKSTDNCKIAELEVGDHFMELTQLNHSHVAQHYTGVMTCLNKICPLPYDNLTSVKKTSSSIPGVMSNGCFWLGMVVRYCDELFKSEGCQCVIQFDDNMKRVWAKAMESIVKLEKVKNTRLDRCSEATALELLFLNVSIQIFSNDPDAQSVSHDVLKDLEVIVEDRFSNKKKKSENGEDQPHWVEVIVEMLLSMLSQGSNSVRSVAEQVFKLIGPHLTSNGLKLVTDVLLNVNVLNDEDEKEDKDEEGEEDEEEVMEVDEQEENEKKDHSDSDDNSSSSQDEETDVENNVDEEFRRRIKEALGNAGPDEEDDVDESVDEDEEDEDFSDDAMMRIDPLLADIFKQRKKSKKASERHTKLQLTHFQLRCIDLLDIFIRRQHSNPLVLDILPPLLDCVEMASKASNKELLAEKASVILRVKLCKMKGYPRNLNKDSIIACHDNIEKILKKCYTAGGVFVAQLASYCCLFYLRVLSGNASENNGTNGAVDVSRICTLYDSVLKDYMLTRETRLQFCIVEGFVACHPDMSKFLAPSIVNYINEGVHVYRKTQAIHLLFNLLNANNEVAEGMSENVINLVQENLKSDNSISTSQVKSKYITELLRLCFQSVQRIKKQNIDFDWSSLTSDLQDFLQTEIVSRSHKLVNLSWKILNILGIKRTKAVKSEKRQKRKVKENDQNVTVEENAESRRERVKRVRKEKKKAQKQAKAKGKKNKRQRERKLEAQIENAVNASDDNDLSEI